MHIYNNNAFFKKKIKYLKIFMDRNKIWLRTEVVRALGTGGTGGTGGLRVTCSKS